MYLQARFDVSFMRERAGKRRTRYFLQGTSVYDACQMVAKKSVLKS